MDPKDLFTQALDQASGCIHHVHDDQLGNATPCTEWDLKALVNHMVYELLWVPDMLAGKTVNEVGSKYDGDVLGEDLQKAWQAAASNARKAVRSSGLDQIVHLSQGDVPARQYINEIGNDMCIHGWDVAQSTQCNLIINEELAGSLYDFMLPRKEKLSVNGDFAPAIDVSSDASIQTKLLALLGRKAERTDGAN